MKSPPTAKLGFLECIKVLTDKDYPWLILKLAKEMKYSSVFQLNLALNLALRCPTFLVVTDHKLAHKILMDPLSTKPPQIYEAIKLGGVRSIFISNGEFWHSRRRGVSPAFSSKHIKRMNEVASQKVDEWIKTRLSTFIEDGEAFDVGKEMVDIIFDALIETAFEYQVTAEEKESFLYHMDIILKEFVRATAMNPFRKIFGLLIAERRRAFISVFKVQEFGMNIINSYRQLKSPMKDTIIDRIMGNNETYQNDDERCADIMILIVAGFDTTAQTIAWTLKELAKNPKSQEELRKSLKSLGREEWRHSDVLRMVVKECMRLHPVAASRSMRTLGRSLQTDDGIFLPQGSIALLPTILFLRNDIIFEDANSFLPSRWENSTKAMEEAFFPFAAGKQNCVGQSLANAEIYTLVPRICSEFELELVDEGQADYFLTLKSVNTLIKAKKIC